MTKVIPFPSLLTLLPSFFFVVAPSISEANGIVANDVKKNFS